MQLTPELLLLGYARGVFPMADHHGHIDWYEPNPRTVIPVEGLRVSKRLARTVRQGKYEIRYDSDFRGTMEACAARANTWISGEIIQVYSDLHMYGFAHSVECWRDDEMVGGLYGVALKGLFAGESMFSRSRDASKVAMVHLVERLKKGGYTLLDVQYTTEHLVSLGAIEISRADYRRRLAEALRVDAQW